MAEITYREAIRQALREEMTRDNRVYIMGEDIGAYGGSYAVTRGFLDEWGPERIVDTPIAEGGILGVATGAAMHGLRPIVELMSINFSLLALDQICNHAAKLHYMFNGQMTVPLVIRTASGWGQLAATHSQTFESWYSYIPGLKVAMPAPTNADSDNGVSRIRSGPNSSSSPRLTAKQPPYRPTSSPIRKTRSSRRNA